MTVNPVDGASYFGSKPAKDKSKLDMETFMRLLTVQLTNQNPLEPMSDRDFFAQMAQLGQVQGMDKLNDNADLQRAQNLFGMRVTGLRPTSSTDSTKVDLVNGIVKGVATRNGETLLQVQEADGGIVEMKMSAVQRIETVETQPGRDLLGRLVLSVDGQGKQVRGIVRNVYDERGQTMLTLETTEGKMRDVTLQSIREARAVTDLASLGGLVGQEVAGPIKVQEQIEDPKDPTKKITITKNLVASGQVDRIVLESGVPKAVVVTKEHGTHTIPVSELVSIGRPQ